MNEAKEWAVYVAKINAVETVKATSKNLPKNPTSVLDAVAGDMIQCGAKS